MDTFVEDKLNEWLLPHCVALFKGANIGAAAFNLLDDEILKKLELPLGDYLVFSKKYKEYQEKSSQDEFHSVPGISNLTSNTITLSSAVVELINLTAAADKQTEQSELEPMVSDPESLIYKEVLKGSGYGSSLLTISRQRKLRGKERRKLSDIVVNYLLRKNPSERINTSRFEEIAGHVCPIFPLEKKNLFYSAYCKTGDLTLHSSGSLLNAYYGFRREHKDMFDDGSDSEEDITQDPVEVEISEDLAKNVKVLTSPITDWNDVKEAWAKTKAHRFSILANPKADPKTVLTTYLETFKVLRQPNGYELIQSDFEANYPEASNKFADINRFVDIVYSELKTTRPCSRELKQILQQFELTLKRGDNLDPIKVLMHLPYLVPPHSVLKKRGKFLAWRPSKQEILDGFISVVDNAEKVSECLNIRDAKLLQFNLTRQPLVIFVINKHDVITHSYVAVNDFKYEVQQPLEAIDLCFKSMFALDSGYALESRPIWMLLQTAVYNIFTAKDKHMCTPSTLSLLSRFGVTLKD